MTELVNSKYIEKFERSVIDLLEIELEKLSKQLDEKNTKTNEGCLWVRYDQIQYALAIMERKFKVDENKKLGDNTVLTLDY